MRVLSWFAWHYVFIVLGIMGFCPSEGITQSLTSAAGKTAPKLATARVASSTVKLHIDWQQFLARHDLVWERAPSGWFEAPFLGNGTLGTMVYQAGPKTLRLEVGRGDVYDHRKTDGAWHNRCRLPIGHFTLDSVGTIQSFTGRLDLWNAEFNGDLKTDTGAIRLRSFVHATRMVMVFDIAGSGGEETCRLTWHPAEAVAPARAWAIELLKKDKETRSRLWQGYESLARTWATMEYPPNPPFQAGRDGDVAFCHQSLREGGETTTAWQIVVPYPGQQRLCVSVAHTYPEATARATAIAAVRAVQTVGSDELVRTHRDWWHAYYPASFLSIPDAYWEGFYWIQMYKLAAATRADGALIDTMGPWFQPTVWPCAWFNLNVQLTYWCVADSNRLELGESLIGRLDRYRDNLVANMPKDFGGQCAGLYTTAPQDLNSPWLMQSLGDLPWAMHDYWMILRRNMDERRMREKFFPLLKQTVNTYLRLLKEGPDGRLHIPWAFSPEYSFADDTNYNLALLRWGCETLVGLCERFQIDDPLLPRWKQVLVKLVDYPTDEDGFMIGAAVPFARSHRHYSHLLMAYPLYLVNVDQPGGRALIEKSLRHWLSFQAKESGDKSGYTWTGASSLASAIGDGNLALQYLNALRQPLVSRLKGQGLGCTTMYREDDNPVSETPFSAAQSIHAMLIQSWGGSIRIFPACPSAWKDAVFHDFRAEGAFLVSAARKNGKVQWVRIKSLAGEPCRVEIEGKTREVKLARGDEIVIGDGMPVVAALPIAPQERNLWGIHGQSQTAAKTLVPQRWPTEKARHWYKQQPWICGFNYIPASAINYTEMWQKETFDPKTIDEELALAEQVRFNTLRCVLQYLVWEHDPEGLKQRMDQFLGICHKRGIRVVFCFFDDCVFGPKHDPYLGKQADVIPGWYAHDWSPSPGWSRVKDAEIWPKLQQYVQDILTRFKDDPRVLMWDLYNEPTNGIGNATMPLLTKIVDAARQVNPSQPLTIGVWNEDRSLNELAINQSDIITFHRYSNAAQLEAMVRSLEKHDRPLICTEWLKREWGSVADQLPVFVRNRVGCLHWGLVNGKTQTQYPWGSKAGAPEPKVWQHDIFRKDRTPYDLREIESFKQAIWQARQDATVAISGDPSSDCCLLFSYFVGNGEDGLHLARSADGYKWEAIGGGKGFLTPKVGKSK